MAQFMKIALLLNLLNICFMIAHDSIPAMEHKKVVEANHFYSDT